MKEEHIKRKLFKSAWPIMAKARVLTMEVLVRRIKKSFNSHHRSFL